MDCHAVLWIHNGCLCMHVCVCMRVFVCARLWERENQRRIPTDVSKWYHDGFCFQMSSPHKQKEETEIKKGKPTDVLKHHHCKCLWIFKVFVDCVLFNWIQFEKVSAMTAIHTTTFSACPQDRLGKKDDSDSDKKTNQVTQQQASLLLSTS